MLVKPESAVPKVDVTVELISRVQRPFLFHATAVGHPPHAHRRTYAIRSRDEDGAACLAMELFIKEFTTAAPIRDMATLAPQAVRE
jgi:hypothetical protein